MLNVDNKVNTVVLHDDDVIEWKHFPRYWPPVRGIHRSPHKGKWRGALMISLNCAWTNNYANNRDSGDLTRHRPHYDVTVMWCPGSSRRQFISNQGSANQWIIQVLYAVDICAAKLVVPLWFVFKGLNLRCFAIIAPHYCPFAWGIHLDWFASFENPLQWRHNERDGIKSQASRVFTQWFVQGQIKENIKALRHWPLWGEFTGDRWIPRIKGQ